MKKIIFIMALIFSVNLTLTAQEKTKGNRNVTIKQSYVDTFNAINIGANFSVDIVYNSKPSVEIETDENLHEVITFEVVDSTLTFLQTMKITSKKKLHITINYTDALKSIEAHANGEINGLSTMELETVDLTTTDNSKVNLNINAQYFKYLSSGKSRAHLNIKADSTSVHLNDNSKLNLVLNNTSSYFELKQRATLNIEGHSKHTEVILNNASNFNGEKYSTTKAITALEAKSDLTCNVIESIAISASDESTISLYGSPEITISKFGGTAKLQKKIQ